MKSLYMDKKDEGDEEDDKPSFAKKRKGGDRDEKYRQMGEHFYKAMMICKEMGDGESAKTDDTDE